jgi:hypothetical protein
MYPCVCSTRSAGYGTVNPGTGGTGIPRRPLALFGCCGSNRAPAAKHSTSDASAAAQSAAVRAEVSAIKGFASRVPAAAELGGDMDVENVKL